MDRSVRFSNYRGMDIIIQRSPILLVSVEIECASPGKCSSQRLYILIILATDDLITIPGSQPWSKSRRQPTATPSTVTIKPSLHPSSSPTHPIVSSKPSCGSTSIITGSPSEVPSYLRVPSNSPSSEQISSQAPTTQPKSGSPSLFATSSVAPSSTPIQSQEPSSNATSTSFPSDPRSSSPSPTPTVAPKKSPSPTSNGNPTLSPSDYPSDQQSLSPTRTLAPSKISSASPPSTMPTMLPSSSYFPSEQPINNSTLNPTTIPTQSPNREDAATASPTRFTIKRRLPQFTLEYEIVPFDAALQNELSELESITSAYLRKQVLAAVSNGDVLLVDFLSNYIFFESEPDVAVVRVTFESIAFFDPMTPVFPTEGEMIEQILDAFTGEEMTGYTGLVQALPSINTFSSSTHIFLMETLDAVDAPLTKEDVPVRGNGSVTPFVIAAAASLLLLSVGTAFWAHGRRRRRRREASEKFINGIVAELKDTTSSRFSATYATDFGDAHQIMEDDDWTMQDIETTEYGTLLHESQNGVNKNHDNGGKYRRNDKRKKFTRTEMEETQDSFDELMKKAIGESTLAVFESASSSEEHLSVVAEDETSQSSTSSPAAVEHHKDDTHICKSRRVPYFLREEG